MSQRLEDFVKNAGQMPSLPTIYYEIEREVDNPRSSLESISDIIGKDQGLTTRLLKLANSALYGFSARIETIAEAIQMIGTREMRDLALATTVINAFKNLPNQVVNPTSFWTHCIACGVGGKEIAAATHERTPERFFVGGLLHDIGRLVMYLKAPEEAGKIMAICADGGEWDCKVENEILGFDHAELGGHLIESWRLPKTLVEMVKYHHRPTSAQLASKEVAVVHFADIIINAMEFGTSGESFVPPFNAEAWRKIEVQDDQMDELLQKINESARDMTHSLLSD